jgi:spore cortex protein
MKGGIRMKRTMAILSTAMMVVSFTTACGTTYDRDNANRGVRNVGYYTDRAGPDLVPDNNYAQNRPYVRNGRDNVVRNNDVTDNSFQWDNATARRIASQVSRLKDVKDASVLINGNTVVVGVIPEDNVQNTQTLDEQVRAVTKSLVRDKQVRVVTDRNIVRRIMDVNDRMDNGTAPGREVRSDVKGIFNDIGHAIKRPFQNNSR